MPSVSFFIDEQDVGLLLDRLNADSEIAFIVPDGVPENRKAELRRGFALTLTNGELKVVVEPPRRWKAVQTVNALTEGPQSLWHVPAGPLPQIKVDRDPTAMHWAPLRDPKGPSPYPSIPDPWTGWTGTDQFGSACSPWVRLELWTRHHPYTEQERATLSPLISFWTDKDDILVVSDFQWTGNYFRPAPPQTHRWWNRMKGWIDRNAVRLRPGAGFSFWAFPSALKKLKSGMRYYSRNWDLDEVIRQANPW
jgi:hypothetical protein